MGVQLVTCRSCGAPNHPGRTSCGRCRVPVPARRTADRRTSGPGGPDETGPVDRAAGAGETGGDPSDDPSDDAAPPAGATPATPESGGAHGGDHDATGAMAPAASRTASDDATSVVAAVDARARTVGAKVLDLLRGPEPSDTQPLDASVPATPPAPSKGTTMPRRSIVAVSVVGLVAGAFVGIAAARGALFSGGSGGDGPSFDAGVYRRSPGPLQVASVSATSTLPSTGSNHYEPELVLDGELTTAWNSDGAGRPDGIGERLVLELDDPAWITGIEFANGYQRDDVRFLANARLAKATLEFDGGERVSVVLLDQTGWQRVPLPQPVLATSLSLEVVEAHAGDTYRDLALSGIRILGHVAVGADREAAVESAR